MNNRGNSVSDRINIAKMYTAGVRRLTEQHAAKEVAKVGEFRGGSTGLIALGGKVAGACGRLTYLRWKGITGIDEPGDNKKLMFEAGLANEDIWTEILTLGIEALKEDLPEGLLLRREEEIPIRWTLPSGTQVSGRPDIVVCREITIYDSVDKSEETHWVPIKGIELKLVSSLWTGREVGVEQEPKLAHLMQAGHYAWALGQQVLAGQYGSGSGGAAAGSAGATGDIASLINGCLPYELWYTNRAEFAIGSGWEQNTFPAPKGPENPLLERGTAKRKDGTTVPTNKKLLQFRQGYAIEFTPLGQLKYCVLDGEGQQVSEWKMTPITLKGIQAYYTAVENQDTDGPMDPPVVLKADGSDGSFSPCDYCELKKICKSADTYSGRGRNRTRTTVTMAEWVSKVQAHIGDK